MAGQPSSTASPLPAAAHVVGNAFVNQYYNVLHQSPQVVHRFYTDASRLTRAEAGADGLVDTVVSQSEIHQKVMSLDYGDFKAEIVTVDSQDSLTGGVLVMVTGALSSQQSGKRNFVQSFFLAPQEKGYFVLNDIFRYLDEEPEPELSKQTPIRANGVPEFPQGHAEPSLPVEHEVREISSQEIEPTVEEIFESPEHIDVSATEDGGEEVSGMEPTLVIDEPPSPIAVPSISVQCLEETSEQVPKKSYASIVSYASILRMKENAGSPVPTYNTTIQKAVTSVMERAAPYQHSPALASTGHDNPEEGPVTDNEVDGRSVFVKNLPMSIPSSHLEEEFGKFGTVKPGGVNVKSLKQGVCYAFVEFEETASAQIAIESSPISVGGRQVYIEEKRPMGPRPGGRGGRLSGTSRGDRLFRSDGLRGRAPFIGRGPGGRTSGQDISSRGRGTGPAPVRSGSGSFGGSSSSNGSYVASTGAAASAVDNNRRDAQGGNGNRAPRRGSNQIPRNVTVLQESPPVAAG
ncbi:unnamed protein product [Calypogeia fissa]